MNKISIIADEIIKTKMMSDIIDFFKKNPNPKDVEYHKWAEKKGYKPDEVETSAYVLATRFVKFLTGGRANKKGKTEKDLDAKQIQMGIKVEYEHLDNEDEVSALIAKRIAMDHLAESSTYYTALAKMEKELGVKE
jgi:hypothetical protein